jgi:AcrR family transcriptional regulator
MGDIAEAVDLTKGGLYYYIKGKKALLYAIMDFAMNRLEAEVLEPARKEEDPELRLEILLSGHAELVIEDTSALTILVYEEEGLDEAHRPKIRQRKRAYADFLRDTIMAVLERHGRTGKIDPSMASSSVLGTIHWIVRWHKPKSRLSHEEVVDQVTELIMHGLVPLRA